jgi:hypothetical protein
MFGHGDQCRDVGVSRLLNQFDQALTRGFQFSEAVDYNKTSSFLDRASIIFAMLASFLQSSPHPGAPKFRSWVTGMTSRLESTKVRTTRSSD